ncbi:MAG: DUF1177 domain-containing protein [bacterium]|nr:DUF1177 domain-containing protein [bacterium]
MGLKQVLEAYELLDNAFITGEKVKSFLHHFGEAEIRVSSVIGEGGHTDFLRILIKGSQGKSSGGAAPTLGIIGRLGGIGARPSRIGLVSDADGAIVALAVAMKAMIMARNGDMLPGDLIITTHICPNAPTIDHYPVPFMSSPITMNTMNLYEVDSTMDAILSVDTTKGNRIVNYKGVAITPTVKEGYILPVSNHLIDLLQYSTGRLAVVLPLSNYDISPYGNGLSHIYSIMQPAVATSAPVVGVAITAEVAVPGCATGATHVSDLDAAGRFCLEVAKEFGAGKSLFYDTDLHAHALSLYGSLAHLQKM